MTLGRFHAAAIDADVVLRWVGFGPELAHGRTIDRDAPFAHQLLARAPGYHAGLRQNLLESFHS